MLVRKMALQTIHVMLISNLAVIMICDEAAASACEPLFSSRPQQTELDVVAMMPPSARAFAHKLSTIAKQRKFDHDPTVLAITSSLVIAQTKLISLDWADFSVIRDELRLSGSLIVRTVESERVLIVDIENIFVGNLQQGEQPSGLNPNFAKGVYGILHGISRTNLLNDNRFDRVYLFAGSVVNGQLLSWLSSLGFLKVEGRAADYGLEINKATMSAPSPQIPAKY